MEAIEQRASEVDLDKLTFKGLSQLDCLRKLHNCLEWLEAGEKRLKWIQQQPPLILSECADSLIGTPTSCRQMKEIMEADTRQVYTSLINTSGRPTRLNRPIPDIEEGDQTDFLLVLCHWEDEHSQFEDQLTKWKQFQEYLSKKEVDENKESQLQEQHHTESLTRLKLWKEYQAYQQMKVDNAKKWVEFWRRQAKWFQQKEKYWAQPEMIGGGEAQRCRSQAEEARSHAEDAQQQIRPVELRLEWIEQEIQEILSEQSFSSYKMLTSDQLHAQIKSQKATSKSDQCTPRNLRSKRADKSTVRSHRGLSSKNKVDSVLNSIHSSNVSRVCKTPTPRNWPQPQNVSIIKNKARSPQYRPLVLCRAEAAA